MQVRFLPGPQEHRQISMPFTTLCKWVHPTFFWYKSTNKLHLIRVSLGVDHWTISLNWYFSNALLGSQLPLGFLNRKKSLAWISTTAYRSCFCESQTPRPINCHITRNGLRGNSPWAFALIGSLEPADSTVGLYPVLFFVNSCVKRRFPRRSFSGIR